MKRPENYKTKQREAIFSYIVTLGRKHVTAAQILEHLHNEDVSVSRTTVFRHLDKLVEEGRIRRYITDGISGACYQYIDNKENCHEHLHLKCEDCGVLQHLECDALNDMQLHVLEKHAFNVNALKTVLYGQCNKCNQNV